jgi:hypothetical protein
MTRSVKGLINALISASFTSALSWNGAQMPLGIYLVAFIY